MHQAKEDLTVVMETAAIVQQQPGFEAGTEYGDLAAEHFQVSAGTNLTPLMEGLNEHTCQYHHWGYVIAGEINVQYSDGTEEVDSAGDLISWPPGHTLRVDEETEFILFNPQEDHMAVFEHMATKIDE